jgi:hypothetical protein
MKTTAWMALCFLAIAPQAFGQERAHMLAMPSVVRLGQAVYCLSPRRIGYSPKAFSLSLDQPAVVTRHDMIITFPCDANRLPWDVSKSWLFYTEYHFASATAQRTCLPSPSAWYWDVRRPLTRLENPTEPKNARGDAPILLPGWLVAGNSGQAICEEDRDMRRDLAPRWRITENMNLHYDLVALGADHYQYYVTNPDTLHVWDCKLKPDAEAAARGPRIERPRIVGTYKLAFEGPFAAIKAAGQSVVLLDSSARIWRLADGKCQLIKTADDLLKPGVTRWVKVTDADLGRSALGVERGGQLEFSEITDDAGRPLLDLDVSGPLKIGVKSVLDAIDAARAAPPPEARHAELNETVGRRSFYFNPIFVGAAALVVVLTLLLFMMRRRKAQRGRVGSVENPPNLRC